GILHSLNPRARIVPASFGKVPLDAILNTHRFDFDAASAAPAWLAELRGEHVPETEALGIRSFVYRRRVPFHPQRLWDLMHTEWLREQRIEALMSQGASVAHEMGTPLSTVAVITGELQHDAKQPDSPLAPYRED
ncbi:hypothetical protein NLP67_25650, partial [Escherichia coli]|nr:hypothetical protein [Escherichia coli]